MPALISIRTHLVCRSNQNVVIGVCGRHCVMVSPDANAARRIKKKARITNMLRHDFNVAARVWSVWFFCSVLAVLASFSLALPANAATSMRLAITTTLENSGLSKHLLQAFRESSDIRVDAIVVGTGQALTLGRRGDVDAVLVHYPEAERAFVAGGYAVDRRDVMYNDFIIAGPADDPAAVRGMTDVTEALRRIHKTMSPFVSRGDDSGTHKKELSLWMDAGLDAAGFAGSWYRQTGSGMGATLNVSAALNGYVLADRATWASFTNKQSLELLMEGDARMLNQYGIMVVSPQRHPHVKAEAARKFADWLTSDRGQSVIATFRIDGAKVFVPNAKPES